MKQKPVLILGAGGHAKVVSEILALNGREILGYIAPHLKTGTSFNGKSILGDDTTILNYSADTIELANGIGALPDQHLRWRLAEEMREDGYTFVTLIHPSAVISDSVVLEEGVQVMAGSVIQSSTIVGQDTIINTSSSIDHDCIIAERCHIAPGVVCSGNVNIESGTHIGVGVTIIQGINIGKKCIIAAGAVVYKNIQDGVKLI
jgi:UDP-perosamine 4-acetyltransferase